MDDHTKRNARRAGEGLVDVLFGGLMIGTLIACAIDSCNALFRIAAALESIARVQTQYPDPLCDECGRPLDAIHAPHGGPDAGGLHE